jgi:hypothetical protein
MTSFQLDQCLDSKRFVRDCAAEGQCRLLRLPADLRNAEDPELLELLLAAENPLLTFDRALPHDHTGSIPRTHPGILIVSNYPEPQTMTVKIAQRILARFKKTFVKWHEVDWSNSIMEVTTIAVGVWHVDESHLIRDCYLSYDSPNWADQLFAIVSRNASIDAT